MKRILVAYDGTEPALHALDEAAELAGAFGGSVTVVSVVPVHPGRVRIDPWDDRVVHQQQLDAALAHLAKLGVTAERLEPAGDPASTIERIAREGGFDTVVVGASGKGGATRFLQGSVSEHVATHSPTTVVIVH
jgi:nucleotide-binding universal stress UspA family protein